MTSQREKKRERNDNYSHPRRKRRENTLKSFRRTSFIDMRPSIYAPIQKKMPIAISIPMPGPDALSFDLDTSKSRSTPQIPDLRSLKLRGDCGKIGRPPSRSLVRERTPTWGPVRLYTNRTPASGASTIFQSPGYIVPGTWYIHLVYVYIYYPMIPSTAGSEVGQIFQR